MSVKLDNISADEYDVWLRQRLLYRFNSYEHVNTRTKVIMNERCLFRTMYRAKLPQMSNPLQVNVRIALTRVNTDRPLSL